jgi:hypothetical protein
MIQGIFNNIAGFFGFGQRINRSNPAVAEGISDQRIAGYGRYMRAYRGLSVRGLTTNISQAETKRIRFNYNRPIIHIGAAWLAGAPVTWNIDDDEDGAKALAAKQIWDRSGGESKLLEAVILGAIFGDMCAVVAIEPETDKPKIEFVDPSLCNPAFSPHNCQEITALSITYSLTDANKKIVGYAEDWHVDHMVATTEGQEPQEFVYDRFGGKLPAVWIPNQSVHGQVFGDSDLTGILDLVEEIDHLSEKRTRIVDYYASPKLVAIGVLPSDMTTKDNTMFFVPTGGDLKFVEWHGGAPDIEIQIQCLRTAISEISETPAIAFGKVDSGFSAASGISLRVLYGPLNAKTLRKRAAWGPRLERLMQFALRAEGFEVPLDAINLQWGDMTPASALEAMQVLQAKKALGADTKTVLGEAGYTADQIDEMTEPPENAPGAQNQAPEAANNGKPTGPTDAGNTAGSQD